MAFPKGETGWHESEIYWRKAYEAECECTRRLRLHIDELMPDALLGETLRKAIEAAVCKVSVRAIKAELDLDEAEGGGE